MKADSNIFGTCELKETVLGIPAGAAILKINIFITLTIAAFVFLMK
jgi:hypothetical protein